MQYNRVVDINTSHMITVIVIHICHVILHEFTHVSYKFLLKGQYNYYLHTLQDDFFSLFFLIFLNYLF